MNTVHVCDVVRALWHLRDAGPPGEVYNLADKGETSMCVQTNLSGHNMYMFSFS